MDLGMYEVYVNLSFGLNDESMRKGLEKIINIILTESIFKT